MVITRGDHASLVTENFIHPRQSFGVPCESYTVSYGSHRVESATLFMQRIGGTVRGVLWATDLGDTQVIVRSCKFGQRAKLRGVWPLELALGVGGTFTPGACGLRPRPGVRTAATLPASRIQVGERIPTDNLCQGLSGKRAVNQRESGDYEGDGGRHGYALQALHPLRVLDAPDRTAVHVRVMGDHAHGDAQDERLVGLAHWSSSWLSRLARARALSSRASV